MRKELLVLGLCCIMVALIVGCEKDENGVTPPPATSSAVYVLNGLGKTLSVIDLTTDAVTNNVATAGTFPNQVLYRSGKLYVVNSGSNNVQIFDATSYASAGTISLGANKNPMNIAILSDAKAYVACSQSNEVIPVNLTNNTAGTAIAAGVGTTGIVIASGKVYASNTAFDGGTFTYGQGTVTVISTATDAVVKTINVNKNPQAIAVAADGKVHVCCTGDYVAITGKVDVIDPTSDTVVKTVDVGGSPGTIAVSSTNLAYLGMFATGVITYNTSTYAIRDSATKPLLGMGGSGAVVDVSGNVYIGDFSGDKVYKVDGTGVLKKTYDVGDGPLSLAIK